MKVRKYISQLYIDQAWIFTLNTIYCKIIITKKPSLIKPEWCFNYITNTYVTIQCFVHLVCSLLDPITCLDTDFWTSCWYQAWVLFCRVVFKPIEKTAGHSYNIAASIAPARIYCQISHFSSQGSWLLIAFFFSPSDMITNFQHYKSQPLGI